MIDDSDDTDQLIPRCQPTGKEALVDPVAT
jgi:hypothetical protein